MALRIVPRLGLGIACVVTCALLVGCQPGDSSPAGSDADSRDLTPAQRASIETEVRQALDDYGASVMAEDYDEVEAFWGDFEDFIHAGDGRVFGDRDAWISWLGANRPDGWVSWEYSDIHVAVLGPKAASYTANFEVVSVVGGEEVPSTGSWTYVLRKTDSGWRVVHSNGKHNEFSYYDTPGG